LRYSHEKLLVLNIQNKFVSVESILYSIVFKPTKTNMNGNKIELVGKGNLMASKMIVDKHVGNIYFSKLRDFLTIGYYLGIIPFKCIHVGKTYTMSLCSSLLNKVHFF